MLPVLPEFVKVTLVPAHTLVAGLVAIVPPALGVDAIILNGVEDGLLLPQPFLATTEILPLPVPALTVIEVDVPPFTTVQPEGIVQAYEVALATGLIE